jgi:hypothetical protein
MNDYMKNGVVRVEENEKDKNKNILKWAKIKYQMDAMPKSALAIMDDGSSKFDYEKIKKVYNASLLDSELQDPLAYLLKKKQDAKTTIMHVFKRKYEEKLIHQTLSDPKTLRKDRPGLQDKLKVIHTAIELSR